jgi:hypothetical protein
MKISILPILAGIACSCGQNLAMAQQFQEHISKVFTLTKEAGLSTLAIYNINGPVRVEGYSGNKVLLEIDKTITAKDDSTLDKGKEELKVEFQQNADSVIAYMSAPYDSRPHQNRDYHDDRRRFKYSYKLEYTVKVPAAMNLAIFTINGGEISVFNVSGALDAHNINGAVTLNNAKGITTAATINGNLSINYLSNPPGGCSYHTINGNIKVCYPSDLSADLEFKSMHGGYYTDFQDAEIMPAVITKDRTENGHGVVYRLNKNTGLRIGKGGRTFRFQTLNGDIFIKKQS